MSFTLENNFIKCALYGTSAIVLSEIGYRYFRRWVKRCADMRALQASREISDVIWINELTQDCATNGSNKLRHDDKICNNRFCYARNIGRIITLIDNAKYSIDLSMYIFTSYDLAQAFVRAFKRGLNIRVLCDQEMAFTTGSQITKLIESGIPVRFPNVKNMLMHHKFCILDGTFRSRAVLNMQKKSYKEVQGILLAGSLNWTHQGFNANWENMIVTSNLKLIDKFEEEFQRMWIAFENLPIES